MILQKYASCWLFNSQILWVSLPWFFLRKPSGTLNCFCNAKKLLDSSKIFQSYPLAESQIYHFFIHFFRMEEIHRKANGLKKNLMCIYKWIDVHRPCMLCNVLYVMQNACFMLQVVMSFMECLERCLGHMMQLSLTDELCISHMHSLPYTVIQTVKAAFKHCKVNLIWTYNGRLPKKLISSSGYITKSLTVKFLSCNGRVVKCILNGVKISNNHRFVVMLVFKTMVFCSLKQ